MIVHQAQIVAYGQADPGAQADAVADAALAPAGVSLGTIFALSVGASVTAWAITTGLGALFGIGRGGRR